jgi:hypothetical protein
LVGTNQNGLRVSGIVHTVPLNQPHGNQPASWEPTSLFRMPLMCTLVRRFPAQTVEIRKGLRTWNLLLPVRAVGRALALYQSIWGSPVRSIRPVICLRLETSARPDSTCSSLFEPCEFKRNTIQIARLLLVRIGLQCLYVWVV